MATYTGDNLKDITNGISQLLTLLQQGVDAEVWANKLPLLGNSLTTNNIVNFTNNLQKIISEKLDAVTTKTPELIKQALIEALGDKGLNGVTLTEDANNIEFSLQLHQDKKTFNALLEKDIGLPHLGLEIDGSAQVGLDYYLNLKFGVNKDRGFYFDTSKNDELTIDLETSLPDLKATGNLGALQLNLTDNGTSFNGAFNVDFKDDDNKLWSSELPSATQNLSNLTYRAKFPTQS
jgi:hypothetical protein